ncbi:MAG TPA: tetratricopeptide repeat protein [Candidatus Eisenbacteria bacterium]|nr:tetratricopeptide repeat protein [Candidatus Eisenbacteria bacterium]
MLVLRAAPYSAATMSEITCPDCGHRNPAGATACSACNYPLVESQAPETPEAPEAGAPEPASPPSQAPPEGPPAAREIAPFRPIRPRRPRRAPNASLSLWLGVGSFLALLLVLIAVQANMTRDNPPVEGSNQEQQKHADELRTALAKDSTDNVARVALADILFDTGNWSEAIVHYRSAIHRDSTLATAIVDLGVCYYNLSQPAEAERLFKLALARDPHQPFALFNLGIVYERQGDSEQALQYFHSALQSSPPENMKAAVMEALQRVAKATGKTAPPLNSPR